MRDSLAMALINYLTTVRFEEGALAGLAQDLAELGLVRPLVIADAGVVAAGLPAVSGAAGFAGAGLVALLNGAADFVDPVLCPNQQGDGVRSRRCIKVSGSFDEPALLLSQAEAADVPGSDEIDSIKERRLTETIRTIEKNYIRI